MRLLEQIVGRSAIAGETAQMPDRPRGAVVRPEGVLVHLPHDVDFCYRIEMPRP